MLAYAADVAGKDEEIAQFKSARVLTYADVCWRILRYADVCCRCGGQGRRDRSAPYACELAATDASDASERGARQVSVFVRLY
jgi:hypothetical protein